MQPPNDTPVQNSEPTAARPVAHLEFKARLLMLFTALLIGAAALYLLYARGVFEATQTLVLTTDDSEGVVVGMDMTFSGFPIGRVVAGSEFCTGVSCCSGVAGRCGSCIVLFF